MKTVLVFGAFDPLHEGHKDFFRQARALGDRLVVVVARDEAIGRHKGRAVYQGENDRRQAVGGQPSVDEVHLGDNNPQQYHLLQTLAFDVLALGYDQEPSDEKVRQLLDRVGKSQVVVARLEPFKPEVYKSTFFRPQEQT